MSKWVFWTTVVTTVADLVKGWFGKKKSKPDEEIDGEV